MFHLAQTVWPRFGSDQANSSLLSIRGPHTTPTWQKISLSSHHPVSPRDKESISGIIVMPDETLRICHMGMLSAVSLDGIILWQLDLADLVSEDDGLHYSLPTALQTGETLMVLPDALLIVDKLGDIYRKEHWLAPDKTGDVLETISAPDDSGFSPNLTYNGLPVLSAIMGDVYVFQQNLWHEIGVYGLDVVTPAVYPDNSLAIAGYAGAGFCRVSLDGTTQWTTQVKMADKLPTLNREHIAAIGSDDGFSAFFRSNGEQIGEYKRSATFAEYIDGGWIALSRRRLARLTPDGKEIWGCDIHRVDNLAFVEQPIVDRDGFIFVRNQEGYQCYAPRGHIAFEVKLPDIPQGLMSIIAPHTMAYVIENELFIGYNN